MTVRRARRRRRRPRAARASQGRRGVVVAHAGIVSSARTGEAGSPLVLRPDGALRHRDAIARTVGSLTLPRTDGRPVGRWREGRRWERSASHRHHPGSVRLCRRSLGRPDRPSAPQRPDQTLPQPQEPPSTTSSSTVPGAATVAPVWQGDGGHGSPSGAIGVEPIRSVRRAHQLVFAFAPVGVAIADPRAHLRRRHLRVGPRDVQRAARLVSRRGHLAGPDRAAWSARPACDLFHTTFSSAMTEDCTGISGLPPR